MLAYMDKMEGEFLEKPKYKPFTWLRYIDIFFTSTLGEDKLKTFLENINQLHPNIKFTYESSTDSIPFLDLRVKLSQGKLETDVHIKPTDSISTILPPILDIPCDQQITAKL